MPLRNADTASLTAEAVFSDCAAAGAAVSAAIAMRTISTRAMSQ